MPLCHRDGSLARQISVVMLKSELIQLIVKHYLDRSQREAERIVDAMVDEIIEALVRGDRVELRGFGAFSVRDRAARTGRNPKSGTNVAVNRKRVPFFRISKSLHGRLNRGEGI